MRNFALFLGLFFAAVASGQSVPVIRAKLVPATGVLVGQSVRLEVEVLVPNYFTGAPVFPEFELDGAIVTLSDDRPEHLNEQIQGTTYAGIRRFYVIYPEQASEFRIPPVEISVPYAATPPATTRSTLQLPDLSFRAALPREARDLDYFLPTSQLTINQKWSNSLKQLRVGDSVTRTIVITAQEMPAMLIPPMQLAAPEAVRIYPKGPTVEDEKSVSGVFTQGVRTEKASYLFTKPGDYVLPGIEIAWWDLTARKLASSKLPATKIHVSDTSAYVSELPPQQETPALPPPPHRSGRHYLSIVIGAAVTLVIVAMLVWVLHRWGPRLVLRYRAFASHRRESEAAYWSRFKHACNRNDASRSYEQLVAWLRRSPRAMTLDEFQHQAGDPRLKEQISVLATTLFAAGRTAGWKGPALYAAVARHRRVSDSTEPAPTHLPPLNPTASLAKESLASHSASKAIS